MSAIVVGGESTGAMTAIAGTLCFLLDDSLYACCLLIAVASAASKLVLYHAFRSRIDPGLRDRVMFGVMLVPSVVFWTSALLKEPVAFIGLGPLVWGAWSLADKRTLRGACVMLFGAALVASVKAYVLFAFICAFSVFIYWRRMYDGRARPMSSLRLLGLAGGVLTAFAGLLLLGQLFPAYALDRIVDETADLQQMGVQIEGGSNYSIVSGNSSAAVQLVYAPLALFTALFRPSIFDVRNGLMLANAMETFVLTAILVRAAFTRPFRDLWRSMWRSPVLMFCATFVAVFGVGVGLATTNFGTLSRYRAPLMPFFVVLVLVWSAQGRRPRRRTLLPATAGPVARTSRRQSGWRSR
jgi:hypothetical protein